MYLSSIEGGRGGKQEEINSFSFRLCSLAFFLCSLVCHTKLSGYLYLLDLHDHVIPCIKDMIMQCFLTLKSRT